MNEKCTSCGGELITGEILGLQNPYFYPLGEAKKLTPKRSLLLCECCAKCGMIHNLRAKEPSKLV